MIKSFLFILFLLLPVLETIQGQASVIDGDTLEIRGQRIRLHGVDAPESDQPCMKDGRPWRCGQEAALKLSDKIGRQNVRCEVKDTDRYGRKVCECFAGDTNLNAWLVANGWAVAYRQYSTDYVLQEAKAQQAKAGIWASQFQTPADYRRAKRGGNQVQQDSKEEIKGRAPVGNCNIKGNISSSGAKIYHVPGGRFYDQTQIDESKGERYFCSEQEARQAGWRKSKQ